MSVGALLGRRFSCHVVSFKSFLASFMGVLRFFSALANDIGACQISNASYLLISQYQQRSVNTENICSEGEQIFVVLDS